MDILQRRHIDVMQITPTSLQRNHAHTRISLLKNKIFQDISTLNEQITSELQPTGKYGNLIHLI